MRSLVISALFAVVAVQQAAAVRLSRKINARLHQINVVNSVQLVMLLQETGPTLEPSQPVKPRTINALTTRRRV